MNESVKVGDILWKATRNKKVVQVKITAISDEKYPWRVKRTRVNYVEVNEAGVGKELWGWLEKYLGTFFFFTKEEAIARCEELGKIETKRSMMKDYERKLNDELGIVGHFVIK